MTTMTPISRGRQAGRFGPYPVRRGSTGSRLQRLRLDHNWTLAELAGRIATSPSRLCQIERGNLPLTEGMAARLVLAFGLPSTRALFHGENLTESNK